MRVLLLFCFACLFGVVSASAQTLTKNSDGEQIIVYPDGSWRYFNQVPPGESPGAIPTPPEEEQYSKPKFDAEAEARARAVLRKQIQTELKEVKKLEKTAIKLRKKETNEAERVAALRASADSKDREQVSVANRRLQDARNLANQAEVETETAQNRIATLEQALPMTRASRKEFLTNAGIIKEEVFVEEIDVITPDDGGEYVENANPVLTNEKKVKTKAKTEDYVKYSLKIDPRYNPPTEECTFLYQGVDEFTQKKRMTLAPRLFFGHTNPELKTYLGDESLVTCTGSLSKNGGYLILELDFVIRSQYANKEFGVLPAGSQLTLKMLGDERITLRNTTLSQGKFDPVEKVFTYAGKYTITNKQAKSLSKGLVDQVRIMWGTGFDDYPIYEVDFFQQQLRCL